MTLGSVRQPPAVRWLPDEPFAHPAYIVGADTTDGYLP